jgi:hypothetical protein
LSAPAPPALSGQTPPAPEGAGVFSSWVDFIDAVDSGDAYSIAVNGAAAGLDTLGLIGDPLGSLIAAGLGWLVEHVAFLREPLDWLAGDPLHITSLARSWHHVTVELATASIATAVSADASTTFWEGQAADAYRGDAAYRAEKLAAVATQTDGLAAVLINSGAMVGVVRALIRDLIVEWVADIIKDALLALVAGPGAIPLVIESTIAGALALAGRIGRRISDLLQRLSDAGGVAARLADAARAAAEVTRNGARITYQGATVLDALQDQYPVLKYGNMIGLESGKGAASAQQNQEQNRLITGDITPDEQELVDTLDDVDPANGQLLQQQIQERAELSRLLTDVRSTGG